MKQILLLLGILPLLQSGCTYTLAVSQSNLPSHRSKPITATVEKFIVLGFNFDNDFALQAANKLKEQCPQGVVRGVTTHDKITLYALSFFWAREITAQGYCQQTRSTADLEPEWGEVASSKEGT